MIRTHGQVNSQVPVRLIYSARTPADVIYAAEISERARVSPLTATFLYTRASRSELAAAADAAGNRSALPSASAVYAGRLSARHPRGDRLPPAVEPGDRSSAARPASWRRPPTCSSTRATPPARSKPNVSGQPASADGRPHSEPTRQSPGWPRPSATIPIRLSSCEFPVAARTRSWIDRCADSVLIIQDLRRRALRPDNSKKRREPPDCASRRITGTAFPGTRPRRPRRCCR